MLPKVENRFLSPAPRILLRFFQKVSSGGPDSQRDLTTAAPEHVPTPSLGPEPTSHLLEILKPEASLPTSGTHVTSGVFSLQ